MNAKNILAQYNATEKAKIEKAMLYAMVKGIAIPNTEKELKAFCDFAIATF